MRGGAASLPGTPAAAGSWAARLRGRRKSTSSIATSPLQRNFQRAMDNLMRLREDDRREEAWTEENAPLQEVRLPPDPVSGKPPASPLPPPPPSADSAATMGNKDLNEVAKILQPVPASRSVQRQQKVRNEANPISGDPAEIAETGKQQDVPPRRGLKPFEKGRY